MQRNERGTGQSPTTGSEQPQAAGQAAKHGGAHRVVRVREVVQELERLRQRAVVLEALANNARRMFLPIDGAQPRYLIAQAHGGTTGAMAEVVIEVATELHALAARARARYDETAGAMVSGLPEPIPAAPRSPPDVARAKRDPADKAILNPSTSSRKQPTATTESGWGFDGQQRPRAFREVQRHLRGTMPPPGSPL